MRPHHDTRIQSRFDYLLLLSDFLHQRADIHRFWKTHSSTYGCWICDLLSTNEELLEMLKKQSPPSLDSMLRDIVPINVEESDINCQQSES